MTYSYDPTQIRARGKDQMRFELGDTQTDGGADTCALADEEYEAVSRPVHHGNTPLLPQGNGGKPQSHARLARTYSAVPQQDNIGERGHVCRSNPHDAGAGTAHV